MATDHLLGDRADHVGKGEAAGFARDLGVEHDLQEEVTEFVAQIGDGPPLDRVGNLVGLLQDVGHEAERGSARGPRRNHSPARAEPP